MCYSETLTLITLIIISFCSVKMKGTAQETELHNKVEYKTYVCKHACVLLYDHNIML